MSKQKLFLEWVYNIDTIIPRENLLSLKHIDIKYSATVDISVIAIYLHFFTVVDK